MKILITGGLGHIGSYLIHNLVKIKKVKKIYLVDNISNQRFNVLFNLKNSKIKFIFGDLTNHSFTKSLPNADIVLHLASLTNAEKSFEDKKKITFNNMGCFKNILNYCKKNKSKLIHISSTSVYGSKEKTANEDEKKLLPQSPYALIKLKEEKILKKSRKLKYISLRFGTISGYSEGMRFHTAVNKFCFNAVMKLKIPIWDKALNLYRPYLSLKDANKAINFIILKNFFPREIFNIVSENKTVKQILDIIKKEKFSIKIKFIKGKISQQKSFITEKSKIEQKGVRLNAKISNDIKETLKKIKSTSLYN